MFCCYAVANSSLTLCNPMHCGMPGSRPSPSPRVCLDSCQLSWWCHSTILSSVTRFLFLPSNFPNIKVFSKESAVCIRWPKTWSFSFSIGPSNEYSGLISFRIDSFDLLAVQGTLKSFIQDHVWKASFLQCSAFWTMTASITCTSSGKHRHPAGPPGMYPKKAEEGVQPGDFLVLSERNKIPVLNCIVTKKKQYMWRAWKYTTQISFQKKLYLRGTQWPASLLRPLFWIHCSW